MANIFIGLFIFVVSIMVMFCVDVSISRKTGSPVLADALAGMAGLLTTIVLVKVIHFN